MEPQRHVNASGRELELELTRVRAEATAARLEARAAELELMLLAQRPQLPLDVGSSLPRRDQACSGQAAVGLPDINRQRQDWDQATQVHESFASGHEDVAQSLILAIRRLVQQGSGGAWRSTQVAEADSFAATEGGANSGWQSRLSSLRSRDTPPMVSPNQPQSNAAEIEQFADRISLASQSAAEGSLDDKSVAAVSAPQADVGTAPDQTKSIRIDAASKSPSKSVKRPRMLDRLAEPVAVKVDQRPVTTPIPVAIAEDPAGEQQPKRRRPAGWLISTTAHVIGLLALGLLTLTNPKPKDQLAFTASVSEASETAVESFTIETAEELPDVAEPAPTEAAAEISPLGALQLADVSLDLATAVAPPMTPPLSGEISSDAMKLAMAAVKGDTPSKVQFAGLDGGGNHFVYLVDSSNSMKKFNEARMELLRSVDSLKPDQRFYVVFYDENPKYMRISAPSREEPASVYATPENKQAFRRWAMAIAQERGKSPPDVLQFAFKLRPDVIFLLSDGEFTSRTETVIRENNRQENLFGEAGPISIIHTIRYPGFSTTEGRQAEVQMRRIAAENGGQYRNVEIK